ncbi:GSCFA domain-containing protein [Flavihumibacter sp. ZG627]|uniref:GSCFA domain-containing protein n=1 Tax=Flavihumibacter sp. ZG627 TaxID=1463156 RepID=UPI00057FDB33|nr:GSCFA domain-containing protein [Flavihumibacter sp. ZG627]KIC89973.1 GSCFA domain-containing protein [Flavihumibacter sp. ZG627]
MKFIADITIKGPETPIEYRDPIFLIGSCFTEHIGNKLQDLKFNIVQNPHGILFDPISVCNSLNSYIERSHYNDDHLILLNELWQSWSHHSKFSGTNKAEVLRLINESQDRANAHLKTARWLIITLGSAFSYRLVDSESPVANCHRAPSQWFRKHMCTIDEIVTALDNTLYRLFHFNPDLKIIFTISPVRHLRDGVIDNNRSKARLLESVHHLVNKFNRLYYFPAYELVIDVLRDYRFYDIDLAHPNYQATEFVLDAFRKHYISGPSQDIMEQIQQIVNARRHKPFQPQTQAHRQFLHNFAVKAHQLQQEHPYLLLQDEIEFFKAS